MCRKKKVQSYIKHRYNCCTKPASDPAYIAENILDLCGKRPIAFEYSDHNDNPLVFGTFDKALEVNSGATPLFHSDRGNQYTSKTFRQKILDAGMTLSMSRVAKCIDNRPMEGFRGIMKREMYYRKKYKTNTFYLTKRSLMNQFNELICKHEEKIKTIVAYLMGMFLNKASKNKESVNIFRGNVSSGTIFSFLDFLFYIYSFYPDYNNTQRFLSILSYIRDEYNFFDESSKLQMLINKYSFIFEKANMNDIPKSVISIHF